MLDIYTIMLKTILVIFLFLGPIMMLMLFIMEPIVSKYPNSKFTAWWRRHICAREEDLIPDER